MKETCGDAGNKYPSIVARPQSTHRRHGTYIQTNLETKGKRFEPRKIQLLPNGVEEQEPYLSRLGINVVQACRPLKDGYALRVQ